MFEKLLSRGERRFGRYFGIPKLMMILCIGMGVTYVADYLQIGRASCRERV